ncbi:uncharacterized protein I206_103908 [Kwoniella pini CBS 10737]|uniref:Transmembrane protein n=1 Tax=Kwoniella pini CBS 10737 TaxID=1296096 RepID=A0A1B9I3D5_9TREE|nr:uncharacterized protein I206_04519 [Kwoniella pini CBS 10737]OCF49988.1 hypothetical protein I206_04519 [Kwoniella pini CBS 10737]
MLLFMLPHLMFFVIIFNQISAAPASASSTEVEEGTKGVDRDCVLACSHWSVTMGYCRGEYDDFSQQQNLQYANDFLSCLCIGTNSTGEIGYEFMIESTNYCLGCKSTPLKIKDNLKDFANLCQIKIENGTAWNAINFMPIGYSTSNDKSKDAITSFGIQLFKISQKIWFIQNIIIIMIFLVFTTLITL